MGLNVWRFYVVSVCVKMLKYCFVSDVFVFTRMLHVILSNKMHVGDYLVCILLKYLF